MAKNLLHCETGFGVYRSTQLGHIPFFLLLYLLVGPSIAMLSFLFMLYMQRRGARKKTTFLLSGKEVPFPLGRDKRTSEGGS
jgi:hypothetical protein